jgi:anti-sigma factor RsiW
MQTTACDAILPLLEAYALGAASADEQALVERHLPGCPRCRRLVDEFRAVAHRLPEALAGVSPYDVPPGLKARLLDVVQREAEMAPPRYATPPAAIPTPTSAASGGYLPIPVAWGRWRSSTVLRAAAAILVVALAVTLTARLSVALARERLRAEYAPLLALVDQQEIVLEVVDGRQTVKRQLQPPDGSAGPGAPYGKLYTRPDMPHVVAMAARLPPPPPGQAYHLWVTESGQTRLAGVIATNEDGFGLLVFDAGHNGPLYEAATVTLQPGGATSRGTPVLLWQA